MLGPMEYYTITITLPPDYDRSITHIICMQSETLCVNITATQFQINLAKCPNTLM